MGLPRQLPPHGSPAGKGSFGEKAFNGALIGCGVVIGLGVLMMLVGGDDTASVGTAFVVLGLVGLVTGGVGPLLERLVQRRSSPPSPLTPGVPGPPTRRAPGALEPDRRNGRGSQPPDLTHIDKRFNDEP